MAQDAFLTDPNNPEYADISRQRKLAEMLTLKAFEQPQGNLVSGRYVAPSFTQQLAPLISGIAGQAMGKNLDEKQLKLSEALRQKQVQQIEQFGELQKADPNKALQFALSSDNPILRDIAKEELKGIKLSEGDIYTRKNLGGGVIEMKGAEKYRAPTSVDMGTLGTMLIYPDGKREMIQKGREGPAGQVLETENGPMLINTRTGQAQPIMANGQAITGSGKPLTEVQGNATGFGLRAKEANQIVTGLENKGVTYPGVTSTVVSGIAGMTPFVGEKYSEATKSLFNTLPEFAGGLSSEQQQNAQGRRNFISAVLRKESGAAISQQEFVNEEKKYFPQLGDSDSVIKQKQDARDSAVKALTIQAGPGAKFINQTSPNVGGETGGWSVKSVK
jgi:hypothetical protein